MSPQGLLALVSLVLVGLGALLTATARSSSHVTGVPGESAGQLQPSAEQAGRMPLTTRQWIGIVLLAGGLGLLLVGAVLLIAFWALFGLVA
jgi:hypothetical protein